MNSVERELLSEHKKLTRKIEDNLMTNSNDLISAYINEKFDAKYEMLTEITDSICKLFDKMDTYEKIVKYIDEFNILFEISQEQAQSILRYFASNENSPLSKELMDVGFSPLIEDVMELQGLAIIAKKLGLGKTANMLNFQTKKHVETLATLLNEIVMAYIPTIKHSFSVALAEANRRLEISRDRCNKLIDERMSKTSVDNTEATKLKKIFDYRNMNKLLEEQGFKEVRQTGSHKIYSDGTKSIPVPQHGLGKGLSTKIQKQAKAIM